MAITHLDSIQAKSAVVAALVDGAIAIKSGVVMITKATAAALTLATPTTGQNGTRITILAQTAAAHTVTAATIGFNEGGATTDVATFGGAIGDGMTVVAYNGEWYTENIRNVTLA